jgi:hypothetical protein
MRQKPESNNEMSGALEIEVKLALLRVHLTGFGPIPEPREIHQFYVDYGLFRDVGVTLPKDSTLYKEWRVRRYGDRFMITGKSDRIDEITRREVEWDVNEETFQGLVCAAMRAGVRGGIRKLRTEIPQIGHPCDSPTTLVIDDYREVNGSPIRLDFVIVEMEFNLGRAARSARLTHGFSSPLVPLHHAMDVTGIPSLWNANIERYGFPVSAFEELPGLVTIEAQDGPAPSRAWADGNSRRPKR